MKYSEYAKNINFKSYKGIYVRVENGFMVYLKDWPFLMLKAPSFYIPLDKAITKEDLKKLEESALKNVLATYSIGLENDTLIVTMQDGSKRNESVLSKINTQIENVCLKLKELGYNPMNKCPLCKEEAKFSNLGDDICPIHDNCKDEYIKKIEEKAILDSKKYKQNALAIILTILFGLVGILPQLLISIFYTNYFSGLVILSSLLALLGYFLSRTPAKGWVRFCVIISIFLIVNTFTILCIFILSKNNLVTAADYTFGDGKRGLIKFIIGFIASFGGIGGTKIIDKFKINYSEKLKILKEKEAK